MLFILLFPFRLIHLLQLPVITQTLLLAIHLLSMTITVSELAFEANPYRLNLSYL